MKGRLLGLELGYDGHQTLTVELDGDFRDQYDALHDADVDIEIKRWHKKRSSDANRMLWGICDKIAQATGLTKEDVYRRNIREVGVYTPLPIREDAVDTFKAIWSEHGVGWFCDVVDNSKLPGYKLVFAYQGSSTYDSKQMSRLIDAVVQDAQAVGVETITPEDLASLEAAGRNW